MALNDLIRQLLDASVAWTQMTQARAEQLVNELANLGQVRKEDVEATVQEIVERSRESTERVASFIQSEAARQFANMGIATKSDIGRLEQRIAGLEAELARVRSAIENAVAPKKDPAKRAAAKKAPATKKTAPRKAAAAGKRASGGRPGR